MAESTPAGGSQGIGLDKDYIKTKQAWLKITECILVTVALVCASSNVWWTALGGGWVQFVTAAALLSTFIVFMFYLLRVIPKLPQKWPLIEFIYHCVMSTLITLAFIVAAARTSLNTPDGNSGIIASAVFLCLAMIAYGIDNLLAFKTWRSSSGSRSQTTTSSSTASYGY